MKDVSTCFSDCEQKSGSVGSASTSASIETDKSLPLDVETNKGLDSPMTIESTPIEKKQKTTLENITISPIVSYGPSPPQQLTMVDEDALDDPSKNVVVIAEGAGNNDVRPKTDDDGGTKTSQASKNSETSQTSKVSTSSAGDRHEEMMECDDLEPGSEESQTNSGIFRLFSSSIEFENLLFGDVFVLTKLRCFSPFCIKH